MLDTIRTHLSKLVAYNSVSCHSNADIVQYCRSVLEGYGYTCTQVSDDTGEKINLLAVCNNTDKAGVMFSAHLDVVPVDDQDWTYPPFQLTEKNDKWYGRGTTDMKGYVACVLAYAEQLKNNITDTPIYIALSHDEEVGCKGVPNLIAKFQDLIPVNPLVCFVGEPTCMVPVLGHKGKVGIDVKIIGKECHSAICTDGVNALEYGARLVVYIRELLEYYKKNGQQDLLSAVPHTTLHTGVMNGGTALNIVPSTANFRFEIRASSTDEMSDALDKIKTYARDVLVPDMQKIDCKCDIIFTKFSNYPALDTSCDAFSNQLSRQLTGYNGSSKKVSYGTEGGLFSQYGIDTIVLGPGDMEQGHKPDEFIAVASIKKAMGFFENMTHWLNTHKNEKK